MSRYIDSDELCKSLKEMQDRADEWLANAKDDEIKHRAESTLMTLIEVKLRIDKQPTADVIGMDDEIDVRYSTYNGNSYVQKIKIRELLEKLKGGL